MTHPIGFGRPNHYPFRMGGGQSRVEGLFRSLLTEYEKGFSTEEGTENFAETYAEALALSMIYAVNGRVSNQMVPERMQENLPVWEDVLALIVAENTPLTLRRAAVASKLRTMAKNALTDLSDAAAKAMGANFVELRVTPNSEVWFYQPGVNPGPEGFQFASNRAVITFVVNKNNLNDFAFNVKVSALSASLQEIAPGWQWFVIGTDDGGFIPNVGALDETLV